MEKNGPLVKFPGFAGGTAVDVVTFFDDFLGVTWDTQADSTGNVWLATAVAGGAAVTANDGTDGAEDEAGGVCLITTVGTADDGYNMQVQGHAFHLDGGYPLYFETRLNVGDVSNLDMFIGLSVVDTEIFTGGAANRIGFELSAGTLSVVSEDATAQKTVDCGITEADDDWIRLAMYWDGLKAHFYVDTDDSGDFNKHVTSLTAATTADYVPQAFMLTPTIEAITGATATAETLKVDYVLCQQERFRE